MQSLLSVHPQMEYFIRIPSLPTMHSCLFLHRLCDLSVCRVPPPKMQPLLLFFSRSPFPESFLPCCHQNRNTSSWEIRKGKGLGNESPRLDKEGRKREQCSKPDEMDSETVFFFYGMNLHETLFCFTSCHTSISHPYVFGTPKWVIGQKKRKKWRFTCYQNFFFIFCLSTVKFEIPS